LGQLGQGEEYVSGDYSSATDGLNRDAVLAVVQVIGEFLPEGLREVLWQSFSMPHGNFGEILKGSMMGAKMSFVVLCLLNRVIFDISRGAQTTCGTPRVPVLVNGDDSAFKSTPAQFERWVWFTGLVGFVVNRDKTGRSLRYVEVNSQPSDMKRGRLLSKPTFGFLNYDPLKPNSWSALTTNLRSLTWSTFCWLATHPLTKLALGKVRPSVEEIPDRVRRMLLKKKWFRQACFSYLPVPDTSPLPMTFGPPVVDPFEEDYIRCLEREFRRDYTKVAREGGLGCRFEIPSTQKRKKSEWTPIRVEPSPQVEVYRMWISPVLDFVLGREGPEGPFRFWRPKRLLFAPGLKPEFPFGEAIVLSAEEAGRYDMPEWLQRKRDWVVTRNDRPLFRPVLCGEWIRVSGDGGTYLARNDKCRHRKCPCQPSNVRRNWIAAQEE
jgi:hypothetical protein